MNRTQAVSQYIAGATTMTVDGDVERLAGLHLLDTLAAVVACRDLDAAVVGRRFARLRGGGVGTGSTILGTDDRAHPVDAAFAGAMTAHAAEINDFMPDVFVQPGPAVVATTLAVAEHTGATGSAILGALVAGYELAHRAPLALGVGNLRRAGIANHAIGSSFGAAASATSLLGLDPSQVADVLSLVGQMAGGSWQWLLDVEHVEKAFVFGGLGARNGVEAALLVASGYRGVPDVVDRPGTWFAGAPFGRADGDGDLGALTPRPGDPTAFLHAAYKRHPVGGPTQPAVEALLSMQPSFPAGDVDHVLIEMPGRWQAFRDAAMPALNLPYLAAIILIDGELDFVAAQSLERMRGDTEAAALASRVEVRHDPGQEAGPGEPRTESARVTIVRRDGTTVERFVPQVLGFPSHPMTADDVEAKAVALVAPRLGDARASALVAACRDVRHQDAGALASLIAR